jgi:hypothetical protein
MIPTPLMLDALRLLILLAIHLLQPLAKNRSFLHPMLVLTFESKYRATIYNNMDLDSCKVVGALISEFLVIILRLGGHHFARDVNTKLFRGPVRGARPTRTLETGSAKPL